MPSGFTPELSRVLPVNTYGRLFDWLVQLQAYKLLIFTSTMFLFLPHLECSAKQLLVVDPCWLYPSKQAIDHCAFCVCLSTTPGTLH